MGFAAAADQPGSRVWDRRPQMGRGRHQLSFGPALPGIVRTGSLAASPGTGRPTWGEALDSGRVVASGERTDLSAYLPL